MKRRYVQRHGRLVPKDETTARYHMVRGDLDPFVSHVDGSIVGSQSTLREHNKRLNVVPMGEMDVEIAAKTREREKLYRGQGGYDRSRRVDALRFALDLETAGRTDSDKQQMIENYRERN